MKKVLCILLCITMLITLMPAAAFANSQTPQPGVIYQPKWDDDGNPIDGDTIPEEGLSVDNTVCWYQDMRVGDSTSEHSNISDLNVTVTWGTDPENKLIFVYENKDSYVQNNLIGIYGDLDGYFGIENMIGMLDVAEDTEFNVQVNWTKGETPYQASTKLTVKNNGSRLSEVTGREVEGTDTVDVIFSQKDIASSGDVYEITYDKNLNVVKNYLITQPGAGVLNYIGTVSSTDNLPFLSQTSMEYVEARNENVQKDYTLLSVDFSKITADDLNKEYTLSFKPEGENAETTTVKVKFVERTELETNKLYCVYSDDAVITDGNLKINGIYYALTELNMELLQSSDFYFAKLDENGYLVPVKITLENAKDIFSIDSVKDEEGNPIEFQYNLTANKEGNVTIKETGGTLSFSVKSSLPSLGFYYEKAQTEQSYMGDDFSYWLAKNSYDGGKSFYVIMENDNEYSNLQLKLEDIDENGQWKDVTQEFINRGVTIGECDTTSVYGCAVWEIKVASTYETQTEGFGDRVNVNVYDNEDNYINDRWCYIHGSDRILNSNLLSWIDMGLESNKDLSIDSNTKAIVSEPVRDIESYDDLQGNTNGTHGGICFIVSNEEGKAYAVQAEVISGDGVITLTKSSNNEYIYDVTYNAVGQAVLKATFEGKDYFMFVTVSDESTDPAEKTLTGLVVTKVPQKTEYVHGDSFDKDGMVVKATYSDGTTNDNFTDYKVVYATEGQKYLKYNDQKVVIKSGSVSADVTGLNVGQKQLSITELAATNREYDGTTNITLGGGQLIGVVGNENVAVTIPTKGTVENANAGNNKPVTVEKPVIAGTDAGNYTLADITGVTVNINKATPTAADFNLPTLTEKTYTGKPISIDAPTTAKNGMGTVTVKYDGLETAPVNVKDGGYKVTFDVSEGQNYNAATGLEIGTLTIVKATPAVTVTITKIAENDKALSDAALTKATASVEGTLSWNDDENTVVTQGKAYGWTFTPNDTANYNIVTGTVTPWPNPTVIGGGGGLPVAPTEKPATDPTQSGNTTTTDMSGSTESKGGQTTTTVDKQVADKLVETAVANKSEEIVISTVTKNQSAASSIKSSEVAIPAETLQTIADKTNANIVIKTDVAEVKLDNKAAEAVASQAQAGTAGKNETVSIVAEKVKEEAKEVRFELKVVTSSGEVISDFNGGNVSITVNVPKSLSNKNIVCVYIDENGYMHKMDGRLNSDGTYSFTTGHFSTYAIMSEEEVDAAIKEQKAAVKSIKLRLRSQLVKTKSGKKAIKLTWTNPSDIEFEGVEIYRSLKKNTGYGKKPIYISKSGKYINTAVKSGKKYYYRVRAFVTIDGEKVYTEYSGKAYRTVK
ncbi:MAG: YDG domain-containing protein [Anaerovoracaceae bacterium]